MSILETVRANDENFARGMLRIAIRDSGMTQRDWAKAVGVSPQFVTMVLKGKKKPSDKLCAAIGLRKITCYCLDDDRANAGTYRALLEQVI
jgi:DNA-binding XRE family transcriptional regulator